MTEEQKSGRAEMMDALQAQLDEQMEKRRKFLVRYQVPEDRSLRNALGTLTKAELDDIRYNLCVQGISGLKKQEMAEALVPVILNFSYKWFVTIGLEQYRILTKLSENDGISIEIDQDDARMDYMRCMGIVFSGAYQEKQAWFLPTELLEVYQNLNNNKYKKAVTLNDQVIRLTTGLLFYYGYLPYDRLYQEVTALIKDSHLLFVDFMGILINAGCWQNNIVNLDTGMHYYTVMDPEKLIDEQLMRKDIDYHVFSYAEVYRAGEVDYIEATDVYKTLVGLCMKEFSLPVLEAAEIVGELQIMLQNNENIDEMLSYMQSVVPISSQKTLQNVMQLLVEMNNTSRLWVLKGHCPDEIAAGREKKVAPAKAKNHNNVVRFVPRDAEIGRNDACPCGSGKKYKKCCLDKE